MRLENLTIRDFRNYHRAELVFSPRVNLIIGRNAQGKTNLLEAAYMLAIGKSFRASSDKDLPRYGSDAFRLAGRFISGGGVRLDIEYLFGPEGKVIRQNGVPLRRAQDLFGQVKVVLFSPDDLQLLKGGPEQRRSYLDLYLAQTDQRYRYAIYNYHRLLAQRNEGLRRVRDGLADREELAAWNETFVQRAQEVISRRIEALTVLAPLISSYHRKISDGSEEVELAYLLGGRTAAHGGMDLQEHLRRDLKEREREEIARGLSVVGPHRDDLSLTFLSGHNLRLFASQGQQRTAALAMKLAAVDFLSGSSGESPLVLLDDVMSELDTARQEALLRFLTDANQTMITSTNAENFGGFSRNCKSFLIEAGNLAEIRESPPTRN